MFLFDLKKDPNEKKNLFYESGYDDVKVIILFCSLLSFQLIDYFIILR